MDEKTRLLISLGASVAANCVPCFEHYLGKTESAGLTSDEIQEAVEVADQVKNGARLAISGTIRDMVGANATPCARASEKSCCG